MSLTWADYLVIGGYLAAITAFGSWFARFQKTTRDYFLTDRSVPWWAVCFTVVATETSTLTFIGIPASAYAGDMTFLQLALGYVLGRIIVSILFIPAYFRGDLFTSYELLQQRFGTSVKTLSAVIFLVTRTLADGIRFVRNSTGHRRRHGRTSDWVVLVLGAAMIVYTVRGGVSAVIWTDVVQMFVYIAGAGAVAIALLMRIEGGWGTVVAAGTAAGKFHDLRLVVGPQSALYTLGGRHRRRGPDTRDPRDGSVPRTTPSRRPQCACSIAEDSCSAGSSCSRNSSSFS